jgi:cell division protein FtsQ
MKKIIVLLVFLTTIGAGSYYLANIPIDTINISGDFKYINYGILQDVIKKNMQGSFLTIDINKITKKIKQIPWVLGVNIKRKWPSQINVFIKERQLLALYNKNKVLVTGDIMLPKPNKIQNDVLQIYTKKSIKYDEVLEYQNILKQNKLKLISILQGDDFSISLRVDDGVIIKTGTMLDKEAIKRRMAIVRQILRKPKHNIKIIDLRYSHGLAITKI